MSLYMLQVHNQEYMPIRRLACSMFSVSELLAVWLYTAANQGTQQHSRQLATQEQQLLLTGDWQGIVTPITVSLCIKQLLEPAKDAAT